MSSSETSKKLNEEKEFLNKVYSEYKLHDEPQTNAMRKRKEKQQGLSPWSKGA